MPDLVDGPDGVIRADLDRIVETCRGELDGLAGSSLLLTGGTGFLGRSLVESVLRFNEVSPGPPCVMTLPTRRPDLLRSRYGEQVEAGEVVVVEWAEGHAIDPPEHGWDYVIHGAATTDPARFREDPVASLRDTVGMAASIAEVARTSGAKRVVLISSGAVYGDQRTDVAAIPETYVAGPMPATPARTYAEAKRLSEMFFGITGLDLGVARVFSVVGPYQDLAAAFAVPDLIRQAAGDGVLRLTSDGQARRSFCYTTDLSAILFKLLLGEPRHTVYNVGCREGTASIAEVAHTIAEIFGGLEVQVSAHAGAQLDYVPDLDRLYEEFVPAVGLREGLLRTCHSLYARGLIGREPAAALEPQG
jgi:dTDP-glucose 4,6-dehydratase